MSRTIAIRTATPRLHSTGLYAPPGQLVSVRFPSTFAALGKKYHVQIGAHTDRLWDLDPWERYPEIVLRFPVTHQSMEVANPFGGLIYLDVPASTGVPDFEIVVTGAVEAPRYVLNRTTAEEWLVSRNSPGPWAEIESAKFIVTVPSAVVRTLDNPKDVAMFWDEVLDADANLAGIPQERSSPERMVFDKQISAGYLHAGYPVMGYTDIAADAVNTAYLRGGKSGEDSRWGFFHEIGHNHQREEWTFDGTTEVTVNLFTLYALETVNKIPVSGNYRGSLAFRQEQMKKFDFNSPTFKQWKSDPFVALTMYIQLQQAFGWEAYKAVFAGYLRAGTLSVILDRGKRDQWMIRFSRQAGRNLGPFFTAWGIPTSRGARDSLADLPCWSPPELPTNPCSATPPSIESPKP